MKTSRLTFWTLLAVFAVLTACNTTSTLGAPAPTPAPFAKEPLTLSHAEVLATIEHMQAIANADKVESDAAKKALLAEHALHLQSLAAEADAKAQVITLGNDLAWYKTKYAAAVKTIWWYRIRFWGPLLFAVLSVCIFLAARFTAWGARTLGPYLVDAGKVAAKAAVLA